LGFFLCPREIGASGCTLGFILCPIMASDDTSFFISSVVGSSVASSTEPIGWKKGDLHGGGGREGVVVAPK
jgi:hypothetical protein